MLKYILFFAKRINILSQTCNNNVRKINYLHRDCVRKGDNYYLKEITHFIMA